MMLLVSDYDSTIKIDSLFKNPYIPNGTISSILEFMNGGNKFMIATARPYDSIISEVNKYNIPYDFLSVLNGTVIYDKNGIIYSKDMIYLDIDSFYKLYSCINKIELVKDNDRLLYYIFMTKFLKCSKSLINDLKGYNLDIQSWFLNTYNIVRPISNKIDSVRYVQELLGIDDDSVITIGDDTDDINMIREYNGYGILKFPLNIDVYRSSKNHVMSLYDLLKDKNI